MSQEDTMFTTTCIICNNKLPSNNSNNCDFKPPEPGTSGDEILPRTFFRHFGINFPIRNGNKLIDWKPHQDSSEILPFCSTCKVTAESLAPLDEQLKSLQSSIDCVENDVKNKILESHHRASVSANGIEDKRVKFIRDLILGPLLSLPPQEKPTITKTITTTTTTIATTTTRTSSGRKIKQPDKFYGDDRPQLKPKNKTTTSRGRRRPMDVVVRTENFKDDGNNNNNEDEDEGLYDEDDYINYGDNFFVVDDPLNIKNELPLSNEGEENLNNKNQVQVKHKNNSRRKQKFNSSAYDDGHPMTPIRIVNPPLPNQLTVSTSSTSLDLGTNGNIDTTADPDINDELPNQLTVSTSSSLDLGTNGKIDTASDPDVNDEDEKEDNEDDDDDDDDGGEEECKDDSSDSDFELPPPPRKKYRVGNESNDSSKRRRRKNLERKNIPVIPVRGQKNTFSYLDFQIYGTEEDRFRCSLCPDGASYSTRYGAANHIRIHHLKIMKYLCDTCGKGFATKDQHRNHIVMHTDGPGVICHVCGGVYKSERLLKSHLAFVHSGGKDLHTCQYNGCNLTYTSERKYLRHVRSVHKDLPREELPSKIQFCPFCPCSYVRKRRMETHIRRFHSQEAQVAAAGAQVQIQNSSLTPPPLSSLSSGSLHDQSSAGQVMDIPPYKGPRVPKTNRRRGVRTVKPQSFQCKLCGVTYKTFQCIRHHEIVVHHLPRQRKVSNPKPNPNMYKDRKHCN